jgi:hypothetical protein
MNIESHLDGVIEMLEEDKTALIAERDALREALEKISERHIGDQPASDAGDELSWAQRQYAELHRIARAALGSTTEPVASPPAEDAPAWQPIDTAPRDGTPLRILNADGTEEDGVYWSNERCCVLGSRAGAFKPGWVSTEAGNLPVDPPTHWQSLPRPVRGTEVSGPGEAS